MVDEQHRDVVPDDVVEPTTERLTLHRIETRSGFIEEDHLRPGGECPGDSEQLLLTERERGRLPSGVGRQAEKPQRPVHIGRVSGSRRAHHIGQHGPERGRLRGHQHVVPDGEIGEQLHRLPRAGQAEPGPGVGRHPVDWLVVEADRSTCGDETREGVDERGLPGTVRPDEAHDLAGRDLHRHCVEGDEAPVRDRQLVRFEQDLSRRAGGWPRRSGRRPAVDCRREGARRDRVLGIQAGTAALRQARHQRAEVLPGRASDADGIEDGGQDEADAADQAVGVAEVLEDAVEDHVGDSQWGKCSRHECTGDGGDPSEIGEGQETDTHESAERVGGQLAAAVPDERAAQPGKRRGNSKAGELGHRHVDTERRRRPLVRAHGEEASSGRAPGQVADGQRHGHQHGQHHDPEREAGDARTAAHAEVEAEHLRIGYQVAGELGEVGIAEHEPFERHCEGQGDHSQLRAADPQCWKSGDHAEDRCQHNGHEGRDRKCDVRIRCQLGHGEPC